LLSTSELDALLRTCAIIAADGNRKSRRKGRPEVDILKQTKYKMERKSTIHEQKCGIDGCREICKIPRDEKENDETRRISQEHFDSGRLNFSSGCC